MSSCLEPSFLRAVILMSGFRGNSMKSAQAALLLIGLRGQEFTGADLPAEVTNGSKHIAGAATGSLVAIGLLEVVGRIKSPNPNAKGRRVDRIQIPYDKVNTARAWLRANGFPLPDPVSHQLNLLEVG